MINQANDAIANHTKAITIVSFHFVLSCSSEPKSILYAQTIINIIAIVPAIVIKKLIAHFKIFGISSICISHLLTFFSVILSQKIQSAYFSASANCIEKNIQRMVK
jgi:hypothetical protein